MAPLCVHLLPDTDDAGAENQARYLLEGIQDSAEFDFELAYFGEGRAHGAFEAINLPLRKVPRRHRLWLDLLGRARRLRRAYSARPPDLLHTWLLEGNIIGLLAARSWPKTRVVISQRGSWIELAHPSLVRVQRLLLGRADHAISNSQGGAEVLLRLGMASEAISVVTNGVSAERIEIREDRAAVRARLGWEGRQVVAWAGRASDSVTSEQKDFGTLFGAVAAVRERRPAAMLAMLGPTGDQIRQLGHQVPEWAVPLGWQHHPADILNGADALAISSRVEGDSNVAGEGLMLGLPVVTTDCGAHCEAVREAGGAVVPTEDPGALATALEAMLDEPPIRDEIRRAARRRLSVDRLIGQTLEVYEATLADAR